MIKYLTAIVKTKLASKQTEKTNKEVLIYTELTSHFLWSSDYVEKLSVQKVGNYIRLEEAIGIPVDFM